MGDDPAPPRVSRSIGRELSRDWLLGAAVVGTLGAGRLVDADIPALVTTMVDGLASRPERQDPI